VIQYVVERGYDDYLSIMFVPFAGHRGITIAVRKLRLIVMLQCASVILVTCYVAVVRVCPAFRLLDCWAVSMKRIWW